MEANNHKNMRSAYTKVLKDFTGASTVEQMCNASNGISTKTGYRLLQDNY